MDWDWKAILFSFRGRLNRAKYWLVLLTFSLATSFVIQAVLLPIVEQSAGAGDPIYWIGVVATLAVYAFNTWWVSAITIKRLHDRGKSGWWILPLVGAPPILLAIALAAWPGYAAYASLILGLPLYVWGFVEIGFLKGTTGPNAYGPDPLRVETDQTVTA